MWPGSSMMKKDLSGIKIYIRPGRTDMRKAINGLAGLVQECFAENPLCGNLYLFSNRGRTIKILYWDRNGFCLWQKRLEKHRFPWPDSDAKKIEISEQELDWLLRGIDFFHAHEELKFSSAN